MVRTIFTTTMLAANLALAAPASAQAVDASPAPAIPVLRPAVTVTSDIVRIGDLVANAGAAADIAIFRAPDPGETGSVPSARVLDAIRPHHLIGINTQNIKEVTVTRAGRAISPKDIEAQIARFVASQFGLGKPDHIAVLFDRELRTVHVEPTVGELRIIRANYDQRSTRFDVVFEPPGGPGRPPLHFTGRLYEAVEVAILTRPLARGEIVKPSDITIERKPKAELTGDSGPAEGAIGLAARSPLQAGQVIRRADVMKPELVHANDTVTIFYEVPGIILTMRGKAIDSGADGDVVSVLNIQSKRVIQGSVSGPGRITIAATLPVAANGLVAAATPSLSAPTTMTTTAAADVVQPAAPPRRTE